MGSLTPRRLGWLLTGASALFIAYETLTPTPGELSRFDLCLLCGYYVAVDVALNILLFLPFGAGLRLTGMRTWRAIALASAISLVIELSQMYIPGRDSSLRDFLCNTIGAVIGAFLAATARRWLLPHPAGARRLLLRATPIWWLCLIACGWLLVPLLPSETYWGQWAPHDAQIGAFSNFDGSVLHLALNGEPLPNGPIADTPRRRAIMRRDGLALDAMVVIGPATPKLAPIGWLYDTDGFDIAILGQLEHDLALQSGSHAENLDFRSLAIRLGNVFPSTAGLPEQVRVEGGFSHYALWLRSERRGVHLSARLPLTPSLAWALILPFDVAILPTMARRLSMLGVCLLTVPFGWWGAAAAKADRRAAIIALVLVVLAPPLVPVLFGGAPVLGDGFAAVVGMGVGALLGDTALHHLLGRYSSS